MKITPRTKILPSWVKLREDEDAPSYLLRPLTELDLNDIRPSINITDTEISIKSEGLVLILKAALRGWKNIVDDTGMEVVMPRSAQNQAELLPASELYDIALHALTSSKVDDADVKK